MVLFDSLVMGIKELTFSANQSEENEEEQLSNSEAVFTTVISLALGIGLFMVLPSVISSFIFKTSRIHANLVEALLRLLFFLVYIWGISFSKDVRRVFQYHGAEHKTIFTYENGEELTAENAEKYTHSSPKMRDKFFAYCNAYGNYCFQSYGFYSSCTADIFGKNRTENSASYRTYASYCRDIL